MSSSLLSAYDMNGNAMTITGSSTSTISLPGQRPVYIRCAAANYSSLNSAVSGMTIVNTGVGISAILGTTTTVTVTNQSRNQVDGIVSLIVAVPPPPGDWPAAQKFESLLPGRSRTFTFIVNEGASAIGQVQVQIGDLDLETITTVTGADSTPPSPPPACGMERAPIFRPPIPPPSCRPIGMPAPITRAASAATNTPSAPRPAARKPSIGLRWAT